MLGRVVWQKFTDVSEMLAASIIRALMMEAAIKLLPDYMAQHPRRQSSSYLLM
jgi:hypothetical protein